MTAESSSSSSNGVKRVNDELPLPRSLSLSLLSGESPQLIGKCSEGVITLTNYRLIMQYTGITHNVPIGVIEQTEVRKVLGLQILCKDARSYKCTFPSGEMCLKWQKMINDVIMSPNSLEKIFAFTYYHSTLIEYPELHSYYSSHMGGCFSYAQRSNRIFDDEVKRLGFDIVGAWRISLANDNYQLCPSYPRRIIVPSSISDKILEEVARFRSSRRIPAVVWRHPNGAVIARSSQPEVGWLWWRSSEDEDLIKALAEACAYDSPATSFQSQNGAAKENQKKSELAISDLSNICDLPEAKAQKDIKKLLIMDARSYTTAVANRARGGGCECLEYYPTCDIQFMSLDNIHTIRKSHQAVRNITSDMQNWLSALENSRWLHHISGLIKAAVTVAQTIVEGRPVLVHCTDGWDRTPQITALAEILLDPYYRTIEILYFGFQVLVEREWIEFGHKFSDRCGTGVDSDDPNERCPVFLQWIDCVHQVLHQYPIAFQFNQAYLVSRVKLAQHVYSCLFGTFLFNSSQERYVNEQQHGKPIPFPVWPLFKLHQQKYINYLYLRTNQELYPSYHVDDLVFFKAIYLNKTGKYQEDKPPQSENVPEEGRVVENLVEGGELVKTKSCDNLLKISSSSTLSSHFTRRSSDPNLRERPDNGTTQSLGGDKEFLGYNEKLKSVMSLNNPTDEENSSENKPQESKTLPKFFVDEDDSSTENCRENSIQKVRDADKRSIEGSTDTLVAENGVISSDDNQKNFNQINGDLSIPNGKPSKPLVNGTKFVEDYSVKKSMNKGMPFRSVASEEKWPEDPKEFYNSSSIAACSICLKSKKLMSEFDVEFWKCSYNDDFAPSYSVNGFSDCKGGKTNGHQYFTPAHSTSNSSCIPSTPNDDRYSFVHQEKPLSSVFTDGLSDYRDDINRRLYQIKNQYQSEIDSLRRELQATKSFYHHLIHSKLSHSNNENRTEDQVSLPESVGSGSGDSVGPESSGLSDASWEALDEGDAKTTLWVPDHAVDSCTSCHSRFWMGRRRHHCRNCGKIFCAECSGNSAPVPKENLYDPVRVCGTCFLTIYDFRQKCIQVASN
ncbi:Myotubularin-related protein 4 [Armadillidium vulgare]|nr:Myotubularin-related protein 4 [Armadillidium vulgare]